MRWLILVLYLFCNGCDKLDCLAQYKLNDNLGNTLVVDSQGFSNGTATDNTSDLHVDGVLNGAFHFDGSQGINCNSYFHEAFNDSCSISLWIKPDDGLPASSNGIFGGGALTEYIALTLYNNGGTSRLAFGYRSQGNSVAFNADGLFTDGQQDWKHIIITLEQVTDTQVTAKLYADNVLHTSVGPVTCVMSDYNQTSRKFAIGANQIFLATYFKGSIDNFMIFNGILTEYEREWLYNDGLGTEVILTPGHNTLVLNPYFDEEDENFKLIGF